MRKDTLALSLIILIGSLHGWPISPAHAESHRIAAEVTASATRRQVTPQLSVSRRPEISAQVYAECMETRCDFNNREHRWTAGPCRLANDIFTGSLSQCGLAFGLRSAAAAGRCGGALAMILASERYSAAERACINCVQVCNQAYLNSVARKEMESGNFACGDYIPGTQTTDISGNTTTTSGAVFQTEACATDYECCQNNSLLQLHPHTAFCTRAGSATHGIACASKGR